jgi:hypothetical protein
MIERHKKLIIFLTAYIIVTALAVIPFTIVTDGTGVAIVFLVSSLLMLLIINIWHGKTMKLKYLIASEKNKARLQKFEEDLKCNREQKKLMLFVFLFLAIITIAMIIYFATR